jgi:hypothetical protein
MDRDARWKERQAKRWARQERREDKRGLWRYTLLKVLLGIGAAGAVTCSLLAWIASTADKDGVGIPSSSGSGTLHKSDTASFAVMAGVCLVFAVLGGVGLLIHWIRDGRVTDRGADEDQLAV